MADGALDFLTDLNAQATLLENPTGGLFSDIYDFLEADEQQSKQWLRDSATNPMDEMQLSRRLTLDQSLAADHARDDQDYYRSGKILFGAFTDDYRQQFPNSILEDPEEEFARNYQYAQTADKIASLAARNAASHPSVNKLLRAIPKEDKKLFDQFYQAELAKRKGESGERSFDTELGKRLTGGLMQAGATLERLSKVYGLGDLHKPTGKAVEDIEAEIPRQYELQQQYTSTFQREGKNVFETGAQGAIGMVPDIAASVASGIALPVVGSVVYWWERTAHDLQAEMKLAGIDQATSQSVSAIAAVPIALIEKLQVSQYFKGAGAGIKPAVAKSLAGWIGGTAKSTAITYSAEIGEEAAQEVIELAAKSIAGEVIDKDAPGFDWDEEWENSKRSLYEAATAIPFLMGGGQVAGAAQTFPTVERVEEAERETERLRTAFEELERKSTPQARPAVEPTPEPETPSESATEAPVVFEEKRALEQQLKSREFDLVRFDDKPVDFSKPQGVYFSIDYPGFESPHAQDYENQKPTRVQAKPQKPLILQDDSNSAGWVAAEHLLGDEFTL